MQFLPSLATHQNEKNLNAGLDDKDDGEIIDNTSIPNHLSETTSESHKESPPKLINTLESDKLEEEESMNFDSFQGEITCDATPPGLEDDRQPTIDELEEFNLDTQEDKQFIFIAKSLPEQEK
ncbi:hypothetical protein ACLOJK_038412 [Asimina triloba]